MFEAVRMVVLCAPKALQKTGLDLVYRFGPFCGSKPLDHRMTVLPPYIVVHDAYLGRNYVRILGH
jgi:hypothetical protein